MLMYFIECCGFRSEMMWFDINDARKAAANCTALSGHKWETKWVIVK